MTQLLLSILNFYKKLLSPTLVHFFGYSCRFTPTCSDYAAEAVNKYGPFKGTGMAVKRVLQCHPGSKVRHYPVE